MALAWFMLGNNSSQNATNVHFWLCGDNAATYSSRCWQRRYRTTHKLRTPYEGINHRNMKMWAYVTDKICFGPL